MNSNIRTPSPPKPTTTPELGPRSPTTLRRPKALRPDPKAPPKKSRIRTLNYGNDGLFSLFLIMGNAYKRALELVVKMLRCQTEEWIDERGIPAGAPSFASKRQKVTQCFVAHRFLRV